MFYYCESCDTEIKGKRGDEFDEEENPAPEIKCPECGALMDYDYSDYSSNEDFNEDMEEYMFPEGRDDGFDIDDFFGQD